MAPGRALVIAHGGGPTPVLNASLVGAVRGARESGRFDRILGAAHCFQGLAEGRLTDLGALDAATLEALTRAPGSFIGSSRWSPPEEALGTALETLRRVGAGALLMTGGNGTMRAAAGLARRALAAGFDLSVGGAPKTIDNDLQGTDHAPGFGSAARYVARATRDVTEDVRSLRPFATIIETMGRHVGWLAAAARLARRDAEDADEAPHLIATPERPIDVAEFLERLRAVYDRLGWAVAVVAEGARDTGGAFLGAGETRVTDAMGRPIPSGAASFLAREAGRRFGMACRSDRPGLVGRVTMACQSPVDRAEALECGRRAALALATGDGGTMTAMRRATGEPYRIEYVQVPLEEAAEGERRLPEAWLDGGDGFPTAEFDAYARPLIGPALEDYPRRRDLRL